MSRMFVTEYADLPTYLGQIIPVGSNAEITTQVVTISGTTAASSAFNAQTKFVRIHVDGITSIAFGAAPVATTSSMRLALDQTEFFGVTAGDKVAGITNT